MRPSSLVDSDLRAVSSGKARVVFLRGAAEATLTPNDYFQYQEAP